MDKWEDGPIVDITPTKNTALGRPLPILNSPKRQNPAISYLARMQSKNSRETMKSSLLIVARMVMRNRASIETFPWHELRYDHVLALREAMVKRKYAEKTINRHLTAVRGVLREAWRLGYFDRDTCERACDVPTIAIKRNPAGRMLSKEEIDRLLTTASQARSARAARDGAIVGLLYGGGLRRFEVAKAQVQDYDAKQGLIRVIGKGNKERIVPLPKRTIALLDKWLAIRSEFDGTLFVKIARGDIITRRHLSGSAIVTIVFRVAKAAGISNFTLHDFRRTYISTLFGLGVDVEIIRKLAGHENITTTARYDRRGEKEKATAIERFDF